MVLYRRDTLLPDSFIAVIDIPFHTKTIDDRTEREREEQPGFPAIRGSSTIPGSALKTIPSFA